MIETETEVVVLNEQPEFCACDGEKVSASYFVLCEEDDSSSQNLYDYKLAGMSLANWVVRVCETQPTILKVAKNHNVLDVIRPYISGSGYSVVLYANTPLVSKGHIADLLGFVSRRRMNVCKLKKGYVFKNDYIKNIDEIYSIDTYDFASNDFFEVKSFEDLSYAQRVLFGKVMCYHKKNGVLFENEQTTTIEATADIGYASFVSSGVSVLNHTSLGQNCKVGTNSVVSGSKIGEDVVIGKNVVIEDCVINDGVVIENGAVLKNSVIGNNSKIGMCAKLVGAYIKNAGKISDFVELSNARICENVVVGKGSKIYGEKSNSVVLQNSIIGANVVIIDSNIAEASEIENNEIICTKRVGE